ncbi:MAG: hypothetical protein FD145_314 [Candidatus Saganbacteria bacterium]|uniref:Uncharacterized protein n=1 Tax=Candidatus Saganbacteria bacterium TaxID=2575572 RepID=A0A833NSI6_UNCSA|nr:MAG: hypothetical protein FD145_314 [Candidatus Saganbacteria bacterium]
MRQYIKGFLLFGIAIAMLCNSAYGLLWSDNNSLFVNVIAYDDRDFILTPLSNLGQYLPIYKGHFPPDRPKIYETYKITIGSFGFRKDKIEKDIRPYMNLLDQDDIPLDYRQISPDGKYFIKRYLSKWHDYAFKIMKMEDKTIHETIETPVLGAAFLDWAPDSKSFIFRGKKYQKASNGKINVSPDNTLFIAILNGGGTKILTDIPVASFGISASTKWRYGKNLFFLEDEDILSNKENKLRVLDMDSGKLPDIINIKTSNFDIDPREPNKIVFSSRDTKTIPGAVYEVDLHRIKEEPKKLFDFSVAELSFSPDGRYLAFSCKDNYYYWDRDRNQINTICSNNRDRWKLLRIPIIN